MSYTNHTKLINAMLAAMASLVLSGWLAATPGTLGTKTVNIETQSRMNPVTITKVTVAGERIHPGESTAGVREVRPGTPFQADEDWLKNMSITLRNRTDKVIVRAEIQLFFPDTGDGSRSQPVTSYTITLGQLPEANSFTSSSRKLPPEPGKQPLLFAPGQTLVVQVGTYVDAMQSVVEEKLLFSQVTRLVIHPLQFFFVDGMRWNELYGFGVPDPNYPGQYKNLDRGRYFPGHPSQNWPPE